MTPRKVPVHRIISGGQTGVDRGALEAAIALNIPHGGWCPRGRIAEDGRIPDHYQLAECPTTQYRQRTERNVLEADGTLILYRRTIRGGTALTRQFAEQLGKPMYQVDLCEPVDRSAVRQWLIVKQIRVLNVAGPRESLAPGIEAESCELLQTILRERR